MNSKIQYILENIDEEGLEKLISNSENKISELFDED